MGSRGVEVLEDSIVFNNLVRAGDRIGETKPVEAIIPTAAKIEHSNARGGLRVVSSIEEVGEIAYEAAAGFKARFSS